MQALVLFSPVLLVLGIILPRWVIAAALGFLLPIDVLGSISPVILDSLRYGLAGVLLVRSFGGGRNLTPLSQLARISTACLVTVYVLGSFKFLFTLNGGSASLVPLVGLVSVVIAVGIAKVEFMRRPLLLGFVAGATASSADILLQVAGLPFLGMPSTWGTRYPGLSFTSTNTAPFIALALVLTITPWIWRDRGWNFRVWEQVGRAAIALVLALGLLLSGGRGGVVGFLAAALLFVSHAAIKRIGTSVLPLMLVPIIIVANWNFISDYFDRGGRADDITSGREERNSAAWDVLSENWLFGISHSDAVLYNPHTPILLFGLQVGFLGSLAVLVVTLTLLYMAVTGAVGNRSNVTASMLAIIMFTTALLEPLGFYVGLAKTTLLLIVLASARSSASSSLGRSLPARREEVDRAGVGHKNSRQSGSDPKAKHQRARKRVSGLDE